jgi:hypothetical protein
MTNRLTAALIVCASVSIAASGAAQRADRTPSNRRPRISGTFTDSMKGLGVFSGTLGLVRFDAQNGAVVAVGTLTGALADSMGNPLGQVNESAALPVTDVTATCDLLRFDLGPADVRILGFDVHLRKGTLGIEPRHGPTQELGNVLCSSANLLDSHPSPEAIATVLNDVLRTMSMPK